MLDFQMLRSHRPQVMIACLAVACAWLSVGAEDVLGSIQSDTGLLTSGGSAHSLELTNADISLLADSNASTRGGADSSAGAARKNRGNKDRDNRESRDRSGVPEGALTIFLKHSLLTTGASNAGSQSTGGSGPSTSDLSATGDSVADSSIDLCLVGWMRGEVRFALPSPPGTDLLRPPRI